MAKLSAKYIITTTKGLTFEQLAGQSILDASIEAGYPINHSCRSGRCGFCKAKVLVGDTYFYRREELSPQEHNDSWILTCSRSAVSDIEIDVGSLSKIETPKSMRIPCAIAELTLLSDEVLKVTLQLPLVVRFACLAGQYIGLTNANGICRSYSLATARATEQKITVHIGKVEQGAMSDYWFNQAKVHDLLTLQGPKGSFFLRDVADKEVFMLATGTGIAPIQALLEAHQNLPETLQARSITLLWGGRKPQDFYLDTLTNAGKTRFIPTLSVAHPTWSGAHGYVQDVLLSLKPDMHNARVYACGSPLMIEQARQKLIADGLNPQHFLADAFVCSAN